MSYVLEKLGLEQFNNKANKKTIDFSKETGLDAEQKRDLELIQKYQNENDVFALQNLVSLCGGLINKAVNESGITKYVSFDIAFQHAVNELKRSIAVYDIPKMYKKTKPSTFFMTNIKFELKKLKDSVTAQGVVRMADDLNRGKALMANASSILMPMLGRRPTNKELLDFIQNETSYGKYLTMDKIEKIQKYTMKELSGSQFIGKGNSDGAETLTYEDVTDNYKTKEKMDKLNREEEVINSIRDYTKDKKMRRFIMAFLGIGQFKNDGTKGSIGKAAMRTGIASYYDGKKALDGFKKYCDENNVWR